MKPFMWVIIFAAVTGLINYAVNRLNVRFGNFLGRELFGRDGGGGALGVLFFFWTVLLLGAIACVIALAIKGFDTGVFIGAIAFTALFAGMTIAAVFLSRRAKARAAADEEFEAMEDYKNHQPDLRVYVEKIIRDWDPVGLTADAPKDAYLSEIDVLETMLKEETVSQFSLMTKILYIFGERYGKELFENRAAECRFVAQRLLHAEEYRPDVEAAFSFNGTRQSPAADGYRPPHELIGGDLTSGIQHYYNKQTVEADGTAEGTINFLKPECYPKTLWIGKEIPFYDDCKIAGMATVRLIFNPVLDRDIIKMIDKGDTIKSDDEKTNKSHNKGLKICGFVFLIAGILLAVIGLLTFLFKDLGSADLSAIIKPVILLAVGIFVSLGIGCSCLIFYAVRKRIRE